jgi:hypothetical protein
MKSVYEDKEKLISTLFIGGLASFVGGCFITFLAVVFRSGLLFAFGPFLALIGIGLGIAGFFLGFGHNQRLSTTSASVQQEGRVVARFAINQIGEMIFDNYDYDAEEGRFYVRIQYLNGKRDELECARPVFDQCGEGMRGMLNVQGSWLAQFTPLIDTPETRAAYRGN